MKHQLGLLFLRLTFAGNMLFAHGLPKIVNFNTILPNFPDPINLGPKVSLILAIFSELVCSLLIIMGLKTRLATIPLIITMLVITFIVHAGAPWTKQEFPLLYLYGFIAILLLGPGKISLDNNKG